MRDYSLRCSSISVMRKPLVLLLIWLLPGFAVAKKHPVPISKPASFVVGQLTYWDVGPPFNFYALYIVKPSESGTTIDKILLTPPADACYQHSSVRIASGTITQSIDDLLGSQNPCAIPEEALGHEAKKCKHCQKFSGAVVSMRAVCGGKVRLIRASVFEDYWFDRSRAIPEHTLTMMELVNKLDSAIDPDERVSSRKNEHEVLEGEIAAGDYDSLFETKIEKPSVLYRGAVRPVGSPTVELVSSSPLQPKIFMAPVYPPIARAAHIQGKASLALTIDGSGKVSKIVFDDAHPMLKAAIEKAVYEWQYSSGADNRTAQVILEFKLNCSDSRIEQ